MSDAERGKVPIDALERVVTDDGSVTYLRTDLDVTYRSRRGAFLESQRVFVENSGLLEREYPWVVAELGFGLGTNLRCVAQNAARVRYVSVEHAPVPASLIEGDDHISEMIRSALVALDSQPESRTITPRFAFTLLRGDWCEVRLPPEIIGACDAVFYDPFGPRTDPESWGDAAIARAVQCLAPHGRLVTYSSAAEPRRAMRRNGLWVSTVSGRGYKGEVTVAARSREALDTQATLRVWGPYAR